MSANPLDEILENLAIGWTSTAEDCAEAKAAIIELIEREIIGVDNPYTGFQAAETENLVLSRQRQKLHQWAGHES
jgi:hypothetical protein